MVVTREIKEEIKSSIGSAVNALLNEEFIQKIVDRVSESIAKTLNGQVKQLEQKINDLSLRMDKIQSEQQAVDKSILINEIERFKNYNNRREMAERQEKMANLILFKLPETADENLTMKVIQLFRSKLLPDFNENDLMSCIRIGKKIDQRSRGVIVKFRTVQMKERVYNQKRKLKGTGIVVKEDLTYEKLKLMQAAIEKTSLKGVWSYRGHITAIKEDIVLSNNYAIIAVTETWLTSDVDDVQIQIPGYNIARRDRANNARGGGVCIYIKNSIKHEVIGRGIETEDIWKKLFASDCEISSKRLWFEIRISSRVVKPGKSQTPRMSLLDS
ncbi:unnamed protein product [Callosobruchus maculatus]|uniref:Uncharacterized protein n=1 Tax=Callosobruchus maculatus TaxID=64391 RepID=A0A653CR73_CALMS|nr:unnamed protein product [Callosobruchus maculatus]